MKLLHVQFKAMTATFKVPFINSGVLVSLPVPAYSTIVGLISCCKGMPVEPEETMIGYGYTYEAKGRDLERTKRLETDNKGFLIPNREDGIVTREYHIHPMLDLYLSNTALEEYFYKPVGVPVLGRSQDLAWITEVRIIETTETTKGYLKPTLIPFPCASFGGRIIRLADYYENDSPGVLRKPRNVQLYQIVPPKPGGVLVENITLQCIDKETNSAVYMHKFGDG